jgi:superfamily II DNA or RNA helicase
LKLRYDKETERLVVIESTRIEYHQLKLHLTRKVKGYQFMQPYKMRVWNGDESHFDNGQVNLGLWKECALACRTIGTKFEIENKQEFPINREVTLESVTKFCEEYFKDFKRKTKDGSWVPFVPYAYQIDTAYKILRNRYCLAEVATSGGKSLIISIVYFYTLKHVDPNAKILIIVPSITLVSQFYSGLEEFCYGENYLAEFEDEVDFRLNDISTITKKYPNYNPCLIRMEEIMSDKPRKHRGPNQPNVYIGCYQSLAEYPAKFFPQFHTVVVDESHSAKATSLKKILKRTFKYAYNRFGVSGTFPLDDTLEILTIQSVLGPKVTQVEAQELVKLGTITPMDIKVVVLNHNDKEFDDRMKWVKKGGNGKEVFQFEKEYIQNSQKRLDFMIKLVGRCKANTLVLFHNIEHGEKILKALSTALPDMDFHYIDGSIKNANRKIIFDKMEVTSGKVQVGVCTYGTLSTGVSINSITNVIFADSFKSEIIILQSIGRALRLHDEKKTANIFDLVDVFNPTDMSNILYKHFTEREKFYIRKSYPYKVSKINLVPTA